MSQTSAGGPHKSFRRMRLLWCGGALVAIVAIIAGLAIYSHMYGTPVGAPEWLKLPEGSTVLRCRQVPEGGGMMYEGPECYVRVRCPLPPQEALQAFASSFGDFPIRPAPQPANDTAMRQGKGWLGRNMLPATEIQNAIWGQVDTGHVSYYMVAIPAPEGSIVEIVRDVGLEG